MTVMAMTLAPELLAQARQLYQDTTTSDNIALRDPVITGFGMAMKLGGYQPVVNHAGCLIMRPCPICPVGKSSYSTKYLKDGSEVWACPICERIASPQPAPPA